MRFRKFLSHFNSTNFSIFVGFNVLISYYAVHIITGGKLTNEIREILVLSFIVQLMLLGIVIIITNETPLYKHSGIFATIFGAVMILCSLYFLVFMFFIH